MINPNNARTKVKCSNASLRVKLKKTKQTALPPSALPIYVRKRNYTFVRSVGRLFAPGPEVIETVVHNLRKVWKIVQKFIAPGSSECSA